MTLYDLIPRDDRPSNDLLLGQFLEYVQSRRLRLYPAQETAILELFDEKNVILNTPTGSGKTLVAAALQFKALVQGKRSVYTCPIKALVNEKWMALCREFGPDNVGLSTGDATVNRDAPMLCCTAEILANIALREGPQANVQEVIMDEFHYYADREQRRSLAGAPAHSAPGPLPVDVGHAWRHDVFRAGADPPQWPPHGHRPVQGPAGAAGLRLFGDRRWPRRSNGSWPRARAPSM